MADPANAKLLALLADSDADDSDGDDGGDGAINRDLEQLDSILKDPLSNVVSELKRRRRRSKVDAKRKTYRLHGGKLNADMEHAMGEANMAFAMGEYAKAEASLKQASGGNAAHRYPRPQLHWRVRVCVPNNLVGAYPPTLASCGAGPCFGGRPCSLCWASFKRGGPLFLHAINNWHFRTLPRHAGCLGYSQLRPGVDPPRRHIH